MSIRLGVGAIFKNESHVIEEWINHYLREGVDRFFLIDNGSSPEYDSTKIIEKYREVCVLYRDPEPHKQIEHYNKYIMRHIGEVDWMIIVDLDEFMYSRGPYDTIKDYLITIPKEISQIKTIWKIFSSNNFIFQPPLVVPYFVNIGRYEPQFKSVFRTSDISFINIHQSVMKRGHTACPIKVHNNKCTEKNLFCDCQNYCKEGKELNGNLKKIDQYLLHLNHYQIQSWEFFRNVKMTRGDCYSASFNHIRNEKYYFNLVDKNNIIDEELKIKHYSNSLRL
jgi:hypothetical protein